MRACASFWAEALPAAIRVFNCSRSSAVSVTRYFFMADSSWSPQQSRPEGSPQLKSATPLVLITVSHFLAHSPPSDANQVAAAQPPAGADFNPSSFCGKVVAVTKEGVTIKPEG